MKIRIFAWTHLAWKAGKTKMKKIMALSEKIQELSETPFGIHKCRPCTRIWHFKQCRINYFQHMVTILASELKCLIYNPSIEVVQKTLPQKFKKPGYCKVRHIIDCTEVFIETPSDPVIRASTWSDYKHHNTAKILVSITPNGAFNFISEAWGGRTSDVHLTRESEFYNILEPYDAVMGDRGFTVAEDLLLHRADLFIPPGKRGQEQFTKADVQKTKTVANLRIFVEQAIMRPKTFLIIKNELPISLIGNLDNIIIVCAALCNSYKPLCK